MKQYVCSLCGYSRGDVETVVVHVTQDHSGRQATVRTVEAKDPMTVLERVQSSVRAVRQRFG